MRCLVTGAAGFVDSHLGEHLLTDGHDKVCGIDVFIHNNPRQVKEQNLSVTRSWARFTFLYDGVGADIQATCSKKAAGEAVNIVEGLSVSLMQGPQVAVA